MARIRVLHGIDELASDMREIPVKFAKKAPGIVKRNTTEGNKIARRFAKDRAGPHGKNYFKRLTAEMTGPLTGEYGPHDGGTPVGAGYRHGGVNLDLPNSADIIAPKFADAVGDMVDGFFW